MARIVDAPEASAGGDPSAQDSDRRLQSIANLLGCETEVLATGSVWSDEADRLVQANEMLRLWFAIPSARDRDRVLALARDLAAN